jgi:hypothetical protein
MFQALRLKIVVLSPKSQAPKFKFRVLKANVQARKVKFGDRTSTFQVHRSELRDRRLTDEGWKASAHLQLTDSGFTNFSTGCFGKGFGF